MITFHLARATNGVIGVDGDLPWRLPADLKRFKAQTMGKPMVMGRKTFEGFPSPLPGRRHIVLTRDPASRAAGAAVVPSGSEALGAAGGGGVGVMGWAGILARFLHLAEPLGRPHVHRARRAAPVARLAKYLQNTCKILAKYVQNTCKILAKYFADCDVHVGQS